MATGFNAITDVSVTGLVDINADSVASGVIIVSELFVGGINITDLISDLENQIDTNAANITQLQTDVSQLQTDVSELQTNVAELQTDVSELQTDVAYINANAGFKNQSNTWTLQNQYEKPIVMTGVDWFTDRAIEASTYKIKDSNNVYCGNINGLGGSINYANDTNGSTHQFFNKNNANVQTNTLTVRSSSTRIQTNNGTSQTPSFEVADVASTAQFQVIPVTSSGAYNDIVQTNDTTVVAKGTLNASNICISTWAQRYSGIRVAAENVKLGVGSTASRPNPVSSIEIQESQITLATPNPPICTATQPSAGTSSNQMPTCAWVQNAIVNAGSGNLNGNNVWTGTNTFTNTVSFTSNSLPTSSATLPAANENSTKIPTTQWVQSAINAKIPFVPIFKNYSTYASTTGFPYSYGPKISFNGVWGNLDYATFKVSAQIHWQQTPAPGINNYYWVNYSATSGTLTVRPGNANSGWFGVLTPGGGPNEFYSTNSGTVFDNTTKLMYYTGAVNNGSQSLFVTSGYFDFGSNNYIYLIGKSPGNIGTPDGYAYTISIEYVARSATGGTVVITDGPLPATGNNNTLP